jgi:hypothetical protein
MKDKRRPRTVVVFIETKRDNCRRKIRSVDYVCHIITEKQEGERFSVTNGDEHRVC